MRRRLSTTTWVGGDDESSFEVDAQSSGHADRLVPDEEEVCEESGTLQRFPRFDRTEEQHSMQAITDCDKISFEMSERFDQQWCEESGELDCSEPSYTLLC